jgi:hypothetical protein
MALEAVWATVTAGLSQTKIQSLVCCKASEEDRNSTPAELL